MSITTVTHTHTPAASEAWRSRSSSREVNHRGNQEPAFQKVCACVSNQRMAGGLPNIWSRRDSDQQLFSVPARLKEPHLLHLKVWLDHRHTAAPNNPGRLVDVLRWDSCFVIKQLLLSDVNNDSFTTGSSELQRWCLHSHTLHSKVVLRAGLDAPAGQ